ncbi:MAG: cytochrome c [Bacteroidetes bacterium]|nr:cytochrome c [Bacteroidota bacterium]
MKLENKFNKKIVLPLITICFIAVAALAQQNKKWDAPETAKKEKNPVTVNNENLADGKEIYTKQCKSCHGTKGKGDGPKSANIDISCGDFTKEEFKSETDGEIYWKITDGRKPMPSFGAKLSDNERWEVVNYIRTLGEKKK